MPGFELHIFLLPATGLDARMGIMPNTKCIFSRYTFEDKKLTTRGARPLALEPDLGQVLFNLLLAIHGLA